jgi:hypothetical protein
MNRWWSRPPSPAMAVAFIALLAAISGTAVALPGRNTVDSGDIKKGAVKTADIAKNAIRGANVGDGSLSGADVKDESLTGADILESSLGTVSRADTANSASTANSANTARPTQPTPRTAPTRRTRRTQRTAPIEPQQPPRRTAPTTSGARPPASTSGGPLSRGRSSVASPPRSKTQALSSGSLGAPIPSPSPPVPPLPRSSTALTESPTRFARGSVKPHRARSASTATARSTCPPCRSSNMTRPGGSDSPSTSSRTTSTVTDSCSRTGPIGSPSA